jgi:hypothetical protein
MLTAKEEQRRREDNGIMIRRAMTLSLCLVLLSAAGRAHSAAPAKPFGSGKAAEADTKESPWLVMPTFSSNPKLGTSLGFMAAYMHYFDEQSQVSMFGVSGQYTSTDSAIGAVVSKASWGADHHRVIGLAAGGLIKNDYNDFLGTGKSLKTEDDLQALVGRYLYRVKDDWFAGIQALRTNYQIIGQNALDDQTLQTLGLTGFKAGGIGVVALYDSRDNEFSPTRGWYMNLNNIAYRDWIAGDNNFDVYRLDIRGFWEHWGGQVLGVRQSNQWTVDAPPSAYAPVVLRGYKMGQYLGKYMSSIEGEERLRFAKSWGATIFTGIACLYGDGEDCTESRNRYPSYGAGVQYMVKQKEGLVASLEYAQGKSDNYGIYLKMGYGF